MKPASPHIFTLTGNLLAERTLEFPRWAAGATQRATSEIFQVGGKGINVSKMLNRLGVPNTALGFVGGPSGQACAAWLQQQHVAHSLFTSATTPRTGTVVRDASGACPETTFLGPDIPPDAVALQACATFLEEQPANQVLAICGSFPGWSQAAFDPLRAALAHWANRGILIADTYGPPLAWAVQHPLALIKINADEFREWGGEFAGNLPSLVARWVVSDGSKTVWLRDTSSGRTETMSPPRITEVSATGSGDVLLAAIIHGWIIQALPFPEAVAAALPFAAANAGHAGIAEFPDPPNVPTTRRSLLLQPRSP